MWRSNNLLVNLTVVVLSVVSSLKSLLLRLISRQFVPSPLQFLQFSQKILPSDHGASSRLNLLSILNELRSLWISVLFYKRSALETRRATLHAFSTHAIFKCAVTRGNFICNLQRNAIAKEVAEKIEQSSTFRNIAKPVAACNMSTGTHFATYCRNFGASELRKELQTSDIYQQLAIFRCRQHCIAGCGENCLA